MLPNILDKLDFLMLKYRDGKYFVLCIKGYSYPQAKGWDEELLQAGIWYELELTSRTAYVTDGRLNRYYLYPFSQNVLEFVHEHFLSADKDEFWIRLEIDTKQYIHFKARLNFEFEMAHNSPFPFRPKTDEEVEFEENMGKKYGVLYEKVNVKDIEMIRHTFDSIYSSESLHFKNQLIELDIDVADTRFYHLPT